MYLCREGYKKWRTSWSSRGSGGSIRLDQTLCSPVWLSSGWKRYEDRNVQWFGLSWFTLYVQWHHQRDHYLRLQPIFPWSCYFGKWGPRCLHRQINAWEKPNQGKNCLKWFTTYKIIWLLFGENLYLRKKVSNIEENSGAKKSNLNKVSQALWC